MITQHGVPSSKKTAYLNSFVKIIKHVGYGGDLGLPVAHIMPWSVNTNYDSSCTAFNFRGVYISVIRWGLFQACINGDGKWGQAAKLQGGIYES